MKSVKKLLLPFLLISAFGLRPAPASEISRQAAAGIDLIAAKTAVADVVTFRGSLPAGTCFSPANPLVATLTAAMLDESTQLRDKFALAEQLEAVGADIGFSAGSATLNIGGRCLRKDLPLVIALLAEQLRQPAFNAAELERVKKQIAGQLRRAKENTGALAAIAFARAVYPPAHPNHELTIDEKLAALETVTPEHLRVFHAAHYGSAHMTLVFVGDLDPAEIKSEIEKNFSNWNGGNPIPAFEKVAANVNPQVEKTTAAARVEKIDIADKTNISVLIGQATGLRATDDGSLSLKAATAILGSGFTGRLMATVRDKEGLTYGIGARVSNDTFADGDWFIIANFAPELLGRGLASTYRELNNWLADGVTQAELDRVKTNLIGTYKVSLATSAGLASALLDCVQKNRPLSWIGEYPEKIAALQLADVNAALRRLSPAEMVQIECGSLSPKKE